MQYMLMIQTAQELLPEQGSQEFNEMMAGYFAFTEEVKETGVFVAGDPLQGRETATTVRIRGGEKTVTDGPFAETKELLAGYYLLECETLDEALAYAEKIPGVKYGSVEIRPVMVID